MSKDQRRRRIIVVLALAVAAVALGYLAFGNIGENLVYYWSPTELHEAGSNAVGASIRLGGLVAPGSIDRGEDGLTLSFDVTDGDYSVPVTAEAVPPAMFREGIGVVVEGTMRDDGTFDTNRLMVKHDNQYQPPTKDEMRDMEELMQSMQFEASNS